VRRYGTSTSPGHDDVLGACRGGNGVLESIVVENINALREEVGMLRSEVRELKLSKESVRSVSEKFCSLYVRVCGVPVGRCRLESLLGCGIPQYVRLVSGPTPSYKVKIKETDVDAAVMNGTREGCFVARWRDGGSGSLVPAQTMTRCASVSGAGSPKSFKATCWNCRGLSTSMPYLNTLMDDGSKILVLSEHWLWPYDLYRLNDINEGYNAISKADNRLNEERDGGRGCGGIGLLWHKSIEATPISGISSDRICGIRMTMGTAL